MEDIYLFLFFLFLLVAVIILFAIFTNFPVREISSLQKKKTKKKLSSAPVPESDMLEIFDYHGTKIIHDKGLYTVNDKGFIQTFANIEALPARYRKMLLALLQEQVPKNNYKLDYDGKTFCLTEASGKKKRYKNFYDIPQTIREKLPPRQSETKTKNKA